MLTPSQLHREVARLELEGELDLAVEAIYENVDAWMRMDAIGMIDELFGLVDPAAHEPLIMLGLLSITTPVSDRMTQRAGLRSATLTLYRRWFGDYDADCMLRGL